MKAADRMERRIDYVRGAAKSIRWLLLLLIFGVFRATSARAQDRYGFVGQSILIPVEIDPDKGRMEDTYAIDFGYIFTERFWGTLSMDAGLQETKRIDFSFGVRCYFRLYSELKPFIGANFLYSLDPKNDLGWRTGGGLEWNLVKVTGIDNLRLEGQTGVSGFIGHTTPDVYAIDAIRIGVTWSY